MPKRTQKNDLNMLPLAPIIINTFNNKIEKTYKLKLQLDKGCEASFLGMCCFIDLLLLSPILQQVHAPALLKHMKRITLLADSLIQNDFPPNNAKSKHLIQVRQFPNLQRNTLMLSRHGTNATKFHEVRWRLFLGLPYQCSSHAKNLGTMLYYVLFSKHTSKIEAHKSIAYVDLLHTPANFFVLQIQVRSSLYCHNNTPSSITEFKL